MASPAKHADEPQTPLSRERVLRAASGGPGKTR
jgi:hypothetical protein